MADKWIGKMDLKKGALHRELGIPASQKIPEATLDSASHSSNPTLRRRASLAKTFRSFKR